MGIRKPSKSISFADEKIKLAWKNVLEFNPELAKQLNRARQDILDNAFCGRMVKKELIPKVYIKKYEIDNLFIYDLPSGWRLLYALTTPNKIEIISVVLAWMNHKEYNKLFKFNK